MARKKPKKPGKPTPYQCRVVYAKYGLLGLALFLGGCQSLREGKDYLGEPVGPESRPRAELLIEAADPFVPEKAKPYVALGTTVLGLLLASGVLTSKPKETA